MKKLLNSNFGGEKTSIEHRSLRFGFQFDVNLFANNTLSFTFYDIGNHWLNVSVLNQECQ